MHNFILNNNYKIKQLNLNKPVDIILIGTGIMSITLGALLSILEPSWVIHIYERLHKPAQESSNSWNNSGTGHAAFCELNYTQYNKQNDSINIENALAINSTFELSLQFWAYLIQKKILNNPQSFIHNVPHMSFVWGEKNINFLKKRFQALKKHILFQHLLYSENPIQISKWLPLMMQGRDTKQKIAVTRSEMGTDINFEEITQQLLNYLIKQPNFKIYFQHNVTYVQRQNNNKLWNITIKDTKNKINKHINSHYIFIGCGGQSLNLLQTSNIPEITGYAGFPVGGQFLITYTPKIVNQHFAKVYGKASLNAPPMSVPHLDTRILNKDKVLLFGPFATFSSKFLKHGSWLDLFYSLNKNNFIPLIQAGLDNLKLIQYLFNQLILSNTDRINMLKKYYPQANSKDWSLIQAGQRVQIIKKNSKNRGILQFGTEIITSKDKTISALLGASPGASISVAIAIQILHTMFNDLFKSDSWQLKLNAMSPRFTNKSQQNSTTLIKKSQKNTRKILNLLYINHS